MLIKDFGRTKDGRDVSLICLKNERIECTLTTFGASLVSLRVPDAGGNLRDVVLGFDSIQAYEAQNSYIGATIGRYANRIGGSRFTLNGETVILEANEGQNQLHGGKDGFDRRVWTAAGIPDGVRFTLTSPHLEGGYPGNLEATVDYILRDNALIIDYEAKSDMDTVCNLTNHSYFNLNGHDSGSITDHMLRLHCSSYTPVATYGGIPNGEIVPVADTPMDFRAFARIGQRIDDAFEQLRYCAGYDHNWVIDGQWGALRPAAEAHGSESGITLAVDTTLPGIQFYTGNHLYGVPAGKDGAVYSRRGAFCLETQFYPDSPNHPRFPQPVLLKGGVWRHTTVFRFSVGK